MERRELGKVTQHQVCTRTRTQASRFTHPQHTQVSAERLAEQLGAMVNICMILCLQRSVRRLYLVQTVADAAQLWGELRGRTNDGLEEALGDLQEVPLVLLQILSLIQPKDTNTEEYSENVHTRKQASLKRFTPTVREMRCRYSPGGIHLEAYMVRGGNDSS